MKIPVKMHEFKKVSSDENTTVLQHPDGHQLTIAHSGLNKSTKKQLDSIPHLNKGGGPGDYSSIPGMNTDDSSLNYSVDPNAPPPPEAPAPEPIEATPPPAPWVNAYNTVLEQQRKNNPGEPASFSENMALDAAERTKNQVEASQKSKEASAESSFKKQDDLDKRKQALGIIPASTEIGLGSQDSGVQNIPNDQMQEPQNQDPYGYEQMMKSIQGGAGLQESGILGQAMAQAGLGRNESSILKTAQTQQQAQIDAFNKSQDELMRERNGLMEDYKNGHVDPNRFYNNMGTGQKIGTAIGLILGGIGGGLTHQENPVMKYLNSQIENDIRAQQINLDKGHSLLAANMQQLGNLRDASTMTRIMMNDRVINQLKQAEATAQGPLATARATQAIGEFERANAQQFQQLNMNRAVMQGMAQTSGANGASPQADRAGSFISQLRVLDPKRAEEMAKRYVPGVGLGTVEIPDASRNEIVSRQDFDKRMSDLINFSKKHSGSFDPKIINQGAAMAKGLQDFARQAANLGVYKESENQFMNSIISDNPTALWSNIRTIPGYKEAKRNNMMSLNSKKKAYGLPVVEAKTSSQTQGWE